jgi:hypothetical protein
VAAALGWGAWRAHTHVSLALAVRDLAGRNASRAWTDVHTAVVLLRDADGRSLAEAVLTPPYGLANYIGPEGAVDCRVDEDRVAKTGVTRDWRACFEDQTRWFARWADRAASARVLVGRCTIEAVPVWRQSSSDWLLWWVPLPHVGGTPLRYMALTLSVDSARCAPAGVPTDP